MKLLTKLCRDESGAVLSSELVLVGTLGVIGSTVGLNALSTAVNEELEDVAFAIRSLDQSYSVSEVQGCGAWTAGSSFTQEPVKESLRELDEQMDRDEREADERLQEMEKDDDDDRRESAKKELEPGKKPDMKKPEMKKPDPKKVPPGKKRPNKNKADEEVLL